MKMRKALACLLLCTMLTGCVQITSLAEDAALSPMNRDEIFSARSTQALWDEGDVIEILLENESLTLEKGGVYRLSGTLENGQLVVDVPKDAVVHLIFNGLSIHSNTHAALYVKQADQVFITLSSGTENSLSSGETFEQTDEHTVDAALFARKDITLSGDGALTIQSPGGHGIAAKDRLIITGGHYHITAAAHAIAGKEGLAIKDGTFVLSAGKDALHSEQDEDASLGFVLIDGGSFDLTAGQDGISASGPLEITAGAFTITCGGGSSQGETKTETFRSGFGGGMPPSGGTPPDGFGGGRGGRNDKNGARGFAPGNSGFSSMDTETATASTDSVSKKGIKSGGNMLLCGGTFQINAADDALHSNASMEITGGTYSLETGDDGIHAEETLTLREATIAIPLCYEGLEALHIRIHGGNVTLQSTDDGLNAAGGTDQSGFGGDFGGGDRFGGRGFGGMASGNGSILITGGTLSITAYGDGIDANGSFQMDGGHVTVCGPTQGDTATLDYDTTAEINGGTFIGTGAMGMAQTFSGGSQGTIAVQVGNASAGSEILLLDASGNPVLAYTAPMAFNVTILSCPDLLIGENYTLNIGTASGTFAAQ